MLTQEYCGLTSIHIPSSVEVISESCFRGWGSLEKIRDGHRETNLWGDTPSFWMFCVLSGWQSSTINTEINQRNCIKKSHCESSTSSRAQDTRLNNGQFHREFERGNPIRVELQKSRHRRSINRSVEEAKVDGIEAMDCVGLTLMESRNRWEES
jgi:hypothetical protein